MGQELLVAESWVVTTGLLLAGKLISDLAPGGVRLSLTSANSAKELGEKWSLEIVDSHLLSSTLLSLFSPSWSSWLQMLSESLTSFTSVTSGSSSGSFSSARSSSKSRPLAWWEETSRSRFFALVSRNVSGDTVALRFLCPLALFRNCIGVPLGGAVIISCELRGEMCTASDVFSGSLVVGLDGGLGCVVRWPGLG